MFGQGLESGIQVVSARHTQFMQLVHDPQNTMEINIPIDCQLTQSNVSGNRSSGFAIGEYECSTIDDGSQLLLPIEHRGEFNFGRFQLFKLKTWIKHVSL